MPRGSYQTRSYTLVADALRERAGESVTADGLLRLLAAAGERVAAATVYRNLDKLVRAGRALRCAMPDGQSAGYRYLDAGEEHEPHYHLLCVDCGGLQHLRCGALTSLSAHIEEEHRFRLDGAKTVLYGQCGCCADKN